MSRDWAGEERMGRAVRVGVGLVAVVAVTACADMGTLDWDLRRNGFSTAEAARGAAERRPQPDSRGVISYPTYQVAVAQRGESVRQMALRLGLDPAELARQNALSPDAVLSGGELLVLPGGGAGLPMGSPGGGITSTPLAPAGTVASGLSPAASSGLPPVVAPAAPASGPEPRRHTVQRGETAFSIARLYNVPARTIGEWNGLPADLAVREGQVLIIPVPQSITEAAAGASAPSPASSPASAAVLPPPQTAPATTAATQPGRGTPTPPPPSAATPLPATNPDPAGQGAAAGAPVQPPVAEMSAQRTEGPRLQMPVQGRIIRAYQRGRNDGIGIGAPVGTEVRAAAAGTVAAITRDTEQVPILVIRHENNLLTVYANIDNIRVERGARVSRGQVIAAVRRGDPPFLHFEVRDGFDSVDPMPYLQ
jgi:murein DD-endopeptidase MepM/ murein hydrolase activator NlpD